MLPDCLTSSSKSALKSLQACQALIDVQGDIAEQRLYNEQHLTRWQTDSMYHAQNV